jgi:hypothetical protein
MLLSVGLWVRPNIMIYANEGGNERYNLYFGPLEPSVSLVHAPFPNCFCSSPSRLGFFVPYSMPVLDQVLELWLVR